jgi:formylmethanofuran dehydrogenase subunit E
VSTLNRFEAAGGDGKQEVTVVRLCILDGVPVAGCCHIGRFRVRLRDNGDETVMVDNRHHVLKNGVLYLRQW